MIFLGFALGFVYGWGAGAFFIEARRAKEKWGASILIGVLWWVVLILGIPKIMKRLK